MLIRKSEPKDSPFSQDDSGAWWYERDNYVFGPFLSRQDAVDAYQSEEIFKNQGVWA